MSGSAWNQCPDVGGMGVRMVIESPGYASNKDFVRHGGTVESALSQAEAEFFLEFAATSIVYITNRLKKHDS